MSRKSSELSLENLKKYEKLLKITFYSMIGIVFIIMIIGVYDYINKGVFRFNQIMFLFFTPLIFVNYLQFKRVNNEIKSRKQSDEL